MITSRKTIPWVTFVILALNVLGLIYEFREGQSWVIHRYGMYEGALQHGEWLRVLVSAFLHFGIYHFFSNMFCLVIYGFSLENRIGPLKYLLIYAVSVVASGVLINFTGGNGVHAGASGAIWGLMTATLIYNLRNNRSPLYALRGIAVNLVYSFSANVSWQGHIGGGIGGLIAALLLFQNRFIENNR